MLALLRETLWPAGDLAAAAPARTRREREETAAQVRKELLRVLPGALTKAVGADAAGDGALKLFELVQCPLLLRNLAFTLLDLILVEVFEDMEGYVDGLDPAEPVMGGN